MSAQPQRSEAKERLSAPALSCTWWKVKASEGKMIEIVLRLK